MNTMKKLLNNQNLSFDTHQRGDGQPIRMEDLHLHKTLFGSKKGTIKLPLLGNGKPSFSGMSLREYHAVLKEVKDALESNKERVNQLAIEIVDVLHSFSSGNASTQDARHAAARIAEYFGLSIRFERIVEDYAEGRLLSFTSVHIDPEDYSTKMIRFTKNKVRITNIRKRK